MKTLRRKWKILQKCLHLVQIVAGLVASRTAVVSILLGSLVKLWVQRSCKDISPSVKKFDKEGYNLDQIFNFDETSLYWKQMASRACILKEKS